MATTLVESYQGNFFHSPFVRKETQYTTGPAREATSLPPQTYALIQKVQDLEKALGITSIDPSTIPPVGRPVLHQAISNLQIQLKSRVISTNPPTPASILESFLSWVKGKAISIAVAVYSVAVALLRATFGFFKKAPPEATIEAILDELLICQAISPAQYATMVQLAKEPEKKPALILLATLLGFSTNELSPLLSDTLNTSPEYAFSLLLECYLLKKFASSTALKPIMNEDDRQCLATLSFDSLHSKENIKQQLRVLRSLSYRSTLFSWIANLPTLLQIQPPPTFLKTCSEALKNNDQQAFFREISPLLSFAASQPVSNESIYAQELLSHLSSNGSFETLAIEIRRQKFLSQWGEQIQSLKKVGKELLATKKCNKIAHRALNSALVLLGNETIHSRYLPSWTSICPTFRASQEGALARNIRKIEGLVKKLAGELGIPESSEDIRKPKKHVVHFTCSCGGGHCGMVQALNGSFKAASHQSQYQFTSEAIDIPTQVTRPLDGIHSLFKKFGLNIDTTWVYNFLLRNDLCSVIEFLKWLTSGDADAATTEKKHSLIRQAILSRNPDFLDMVYAFDGNDLDAVSQQLGLPLLYVATDLDLNDWKKNPTSPFFREAIPTLQHRGIRSSLHIPEDKVEEIGLCVGPEFETVLSTQQLNAVRLRYGITPTEKVVVFSNGGTALQNTIPERIALQYNDALTPIHLIVICGKNESFKEYLEKSILPSIPKNAPVQMTVLGFQQRAQMAELSQLADVVIGKPGGMSTMEFVKSGTRVIFDETSFRLHWERFNADVVVNSGRGLIMNDPDTILSLIKESLKTPRRSPMKMAQTRASERYVDLVSRLLTAANRPEAEHGWREKRKSWYKMNTLMASTTIGY